MPVLRRDRTVAELQPGANVEPGSQNEPAFDRYAWGVEVVLLDRELVPDEREQFALRARHDPAASSGKPSARRSEQEIARSWRLSGCGLSGGRNGREEQDGQYENGRREGSLSAAIRQRVLLGGWSGPAEQIVHHGRRPLVGGATKKIRPSEVTSPSPEERERVTITAPYRDGSGGRGGARPA